MFQRFSGVDPLPPPKSPEVLCVPRTVLGFRLLSFCSTSKISQVDHKHGSSIVPSDSTLCLPPWCSSADTQKGRLIAPWRLLVGCRRGALDARAVCGMVRGTGGGEFPTGQWRPSHVKQMSPKSKPASEVSHVCCNQP